MRIAQICPNCATYINAACIIYDGNYLASIGAAPMDPLDSILGKINNTFPALTGTGVPASVPAFIGQYYYDTSASNLYIGLSTTSPDWGLVGVVITTTTTSTTSTTSTTTSHP